MVFSPCSRVFHVNLVFSILPFNMVSKHNDENLAAIGENQLVQDNFSYAPVLLQPQLPPIFPLSSFLSKPVLIVIFNPCISVQF